MSLLARNLQLIAIGVFLVTCMCQWHFHRVEDLRERMTKQAISELPLEEQHRPFPVIVLVDPSFLPEGLVAAGIGCVAYRMNLRQFKTRDKHPIARSLVTAGVVAVLSLVLSVGAMAIGTMAAM